MTTVEGLIEDCIPPFEFDDEVCNPELPSRWFVRNHFPTGRKVHAYSKPEYLMELAMALQGTPEMETIMKTQFGSLFEIPMRKLTYSAQLVHALLSRQVECGRPHEAWFVFGGKPLKFSLREFCIVTGLKGHRYDKPNIVEEGAVGGEENTEAVDLNADDIGGEGSQGVEKHWDSLIGKDDNGDFDILLTRLTTDKDMEGWKRLQLALVIIVDGILLGANQYYYVSGETVEMVKDVKSFCEYPWGRKSFEMTMKNFAEIVKRNDLKTRLTNQSVTMIGFPLAIQLLAFETIPKLVGQLPCPSAEQDFTPRSCKRLYTKRSITYSEIIAVENDKNLAVDSIVHADDDEIDPNIWDWSDDEDDEKIRYVENILKSSTSSNPFGQRSWPGGDICCPRVLTPKELETYKKNIQEKERKGKGKKRGRSRDEEVSGGSVARRTLSKADGEWKKERSMLIKDAVGKAVEKSKSMWSGKWREEVKEMIVESVAEGVAQCVGDIVEKKLEELLRKHNIFDKVKMSKNKEVNDGKKDDPSMSLNLDEEEIGGGIFESHDDYGSFGQDRFEADANGTEANDCVGGRQNSEEGVPKEDRFEADANGTEGNDCVGGRQTSEEGVPNEIHERPVSEEVRDGHEVDDVAEDNGGNQYSHADGEGSKDEEGHEAMEETETVEELGGGKCQYQRQVVNDSSRMNPESNRSENINEAGGRNVEVWDVVVHKSFPLERCTGGTSKGGRHPSERTPEAKAGNGDEQCYGEQCTPLMCSLGSHVSQRTIITRKGDRIRTRNPWYGSPFVTVPGQKKLVSQSTNPLDGATAEERLRAVEVATQLLKSEYITLSTGHALLTSTVSHVATPGKDLDYELMSVLMVLIWRRRAKEYEERKITMVDSILPDLLSRSYSTFERLFFEDLYEWDHSIVSYVLGNASKGLPQKIWVKEADRVYLPMRWPDEHWVGLVIHIRTRSIDVLDTRKSETSDEQFENIMEPIRTMLPYLLRKWCRGKEKIIKLKPWRITRNAHVAQDESGGNSAPLTIKYLEMHSAGSSVELMESIDAAKVIDIRMKLYCDLINMVVPYSAK